MKGYYCIALSDYKGNLLDIYESRFLRTGNIQTDNVYIVGVASDKTEAFEVVRSIIEDVYLHTGGFDVRGYLGITVERCWCVTYHSVNFKNRWIYSSRNYRIASRADAYRSVCTCLL